MAKKKIKTRLGNDGYDYPYTSTDLVKDNEGKSVTTKFEEVNEQYNTINEEKLGKNSILTMTNMGQDVKEAMTGGSVAVVGENAILTENIVDKQITPAKTSFIEIETSGNLLDYFNVESVDHIYLQDGSSFSGQNYQIKVNQLDKDFSFNFDTYVTFWDSEGTFISGYPYTSLVLIYKGTLFAKDIPSNTDYILFSIWKSNYESKKCVFCYSENYRLDLQTNYFLNNPINIDNTKLGKVNTIDYIEQKIPNITFKLYEKGNLIDYNKLIQNYYVDNNTGALVENSGGLVTDYIEIDATESYTIDYIAYICYYDSNKQFISGYIQGSCSKECLCKLRNIPSNAKYLRTSMWREEYNNNILALTNCYKSNLKCNYYIPSIISCDKGEVEYNINPIANKKFIFFGDSWCAGNTTAPDGWAGGIYKLNPSITYKNCGQHGSTWGQCYYNWFVNEENKNSLSDDADYIIIEAFTNGLYGDVNSNMDKPLGAEIDEFTYYNSVEEIRSLGDTYAVDMESVLFSIANRWNGKKIGLIFPYKSVDMIRENNLFRQFRPEVLKCCRKYNIAVFDNFDECNIPNWNQEMIDKYFFHGDDNKEHADGVHLNSLGYSIITPKIEKWIKTL